MTIKYTKIIEIPDNSNVLRQINEQGYEEEPYNSIEEFINSYYDLDLPFSECIEALECCPAVAHGEETLITDNKIYHKGVRK